MFHDVSAALSRHSLLRHAALQCRQLFGFALFFSACLNLLFIAPTLYMLQVYNRVVPNEGTGTLILLTSILAAALGVLAMLDMVRSRLLVRAGARLERALAPAILRAGIVNSVNGRAAPSAALRDFDNLRNILSGPAISAVCDAPWTPIYVIVCFVLHPLIGMLATAGVVAILALAWTNNRRTTGPMSRANTAATLGYASYETSVAGAQAIAALGMAEARIRGHLGEREEMVMLQTAASLEATRLASVSKGIRLLLQSLALGLGALLAIGHSISPGAIFASMFMVGRALAPIDQLLASWKSIGQARQSFDRVVGLLEELPPELNRTKLPAPQGALSACSVSVEDQPSGRILLSGISLGLASGEALAIIGPNGAGKSTLLRVLAGAQQVSSGDIRFDASDQRDWDPQWLGQHIGFMPQEPTLFAGTIRDNIARFRQSDDKDALDAAVINAATIAGAHDMIVSLPGGYDHCLDFGGRGLSVGQAQQVSLARALFGAPPYLMLDEPNAHLDCDADTRLLEALRDLKKGGTTILFVAHKLHLLAIADSIVLLDRGRIRLSGPRDDVLRELTPRSSPRVVPRTASAA